MNIVVLAGGISTEREISLVTGSKVCEALIEKNHNAILVDVYLGREDIPSDIFEKKFDVEAELLRIKSIEYKIDTIKASNREFFGDNVIELCKMADFVFLGLHGVDGEDGKIQAVFDLLKIKYSGTGYIGSALAMDKSLTKALWEKNNIPTPGGITITKDTNDKSLKAIGQKVPCVVKPACGGSSIGVSLVFSEDEYEAALEEAFKYEDNVVIEQYISGRELSIGVVDGKALPVIEITPIEGFYDYTNKYNAGRTIEVCPAKIDENTTEKLKRSAEEAGEALMLSNYYRIDYILCENGDFYALEGNTLPGMTPTSLIPQEAAAEGMSFSDLCEKLIEVSLKNNL